MRHYLSLAAVVFLLAVTGWLYKVRPAYVTASGPAEGDVPSDGDPITIRAIAPQASADGVIESAPFNKVDFLYDLKNTAGRSLCDVSSGFCGCQVTQALPPVVPPGATARFGFRLTAPAAGTSTTVVALRERGATEPVAILECRIRVQVMPPTWLSRPRELHLHFVENAPGDVEVMVDAIERVGSTCWIEAAAIETSDAQLAAAVDPPTERAMDDPKLVRRTYRIHIRTIGTAAGEYRGWLSFRAADAGSPTPEPVMWTASVLPRLSVYPDRLALECDPHVQSVPSRIVVVDRKPSGTKLRIDFDSNLLDVQPVSDADSKITQFDVRTKPSASTNVQDSEISLIADGGASRVLPVRISPRRE